MNILNAASIFYHFGPFRNQQATLLFILFKSFKDKTQQLLFTKQFDEKHIGSIVSSYSINRYIRCIPIYGIDLPNGKNNIVLGKYTIIRGNHLKTYLKRQLNQSFKKNVILDGIAQNKVILAIDYNVRDPYFINDIYENDAMNFVHMVRFMAGIKNQNVYIDLKEFVPYLDSAVSVSSSTISSNSNIHNKYNTLFLDKKYFSQKRYNFDKLWEFLNGNTTKLENRILSAVKWISMSIEEENSEIALTELAFAFEGLLKKSKDVVINPSIQGQISEAVALIIGKNYSDRVKIISQFIDFYKYRSAIVHGAEKKDNVPDYFVMLDLLRICIIWITGKIKSKQWTSIDDFYDYIDMKKFK